jgi:hypothetical protein
MKKIRLESEFNFFTMNAYGPCIKPEHRLEVYHDSTLRCPRLPVNAIALIKFDPGGGSQASFSFKSQ